MAERARAAAGERWVVKLGSALLTDHGRGLAVDRLVDWARQMSALLEAGVQLVVVSSGAVAEGMRRLGWRVRPSELHELQAAAAVGQMGLAQAWERAFQRHGVHTAQVLLTHSDLSDRQRYLNARSVLRTLIAERVVPVVNENDTVATDELRFGDNDTLAGLVANLLEVDRLVLLTDQPGLFSADPRHDPQARLVERAPAGDPALDAMAGAGNEWGRGGMRTKLAAARLAARSGTRTVIASGLEDDVLLRLAAGEPTGTTLLPDSGRLTARKRWLAGTLRPAGELWLDAGAARVLRERGSSLLPVGVTRATGAFRRGDLVVCRDPDGREVARGLVNYSAEEVGRILGCPSGEIAARLGYANEPELVHRDNLALS